MSDFQLAADRDAPESEVLRLRCMFANGEITEEVMLWTLGLIDIDDDIPWHMMSQAQKRRYFAKQKANNEVGDLFGNSKKFRKTRKSRRAKRYIIPVAEIGGTVEAAE